MKTTVKKWAFSLVLLSLMASCGGDNNTAGGAGDIVNNNDNLNNGVNTATGTATFNGFINEVENGRFEGQSKDRDFRFLEVFGGSTGSSDNCDEFLGIPYCTYSYGSSSNYQNTSSLGYRRFDNNGNVTFRASSLEGIDDFGNNLNQIRDRLVQKMRNADKVYKCLSGYGNGEQCYTLSQWNNLYMQSQSPWSGFYMHSDPTREKSNRYIFEYGDATYLVDLKKPLGAQPIGIIKNGKQFEYFESFY